MNTRAGLNLYGLAVSNLRAAEVPQQTITHASIGVAALQAMCHSLAKCSGWWEEYERMPAELRKHFLAGKIALVHSEVSEALEGLRKSKMDDHLPERPSLEVEFADAIIRIMDMSGKLDLDVAGAIIEKLAYNQQRPDHKKEAREAEGGKSL